MATGKALNKLSDLWDEVSMSTPSDGSIHRAVSRRLKQAWVIKVGLAVSCLAVCVFAYFWGRMEGGETIALLSQQNAVLLERLDAAEAEHQTNLHTITLLESAGKLDKLALEHVRSLVTELEQEKKQLTEELFFFRSILSPESVKTSVRVHGLSLLKTLEPDSFQLRFTIAQFARIHNFRRGNIQVSLIGQQNDKQTVLSVIQMAGLTESSLPLGFRYFQVLPGAQSYYNFTLPAGFTPQHIEITIAMKQGEVRTVKEVFEWDKALADTNPAL